MSNQSGVPRNSFHIRKQDGKEELIRRVPERTRPIIVSGIGRQDHQSLKEQLQPLATTAAKRHLIAALLSSSFRQVRECEKNKEQKK